MSGVNKVILVGNLGRDPELRHTSGGQAVCRLSVATTRKWRSKQTQEMVEETEWHRVTVWGQSAEHCNNYLVKGRQVYVEGRLKTSSYDKDGVQTYSTEIVADDVQFLGGRSDDGGGQRRDSYGQGGASGYQRDSGPPQRKQAAAPAAYDPGDYSPKGGEDDDIPF